MSQGLSDRAPRRDEITFEEFDATEAFVPEAAVRDLLRYAVDLGASDVFLTDEADHVSVRMRQMGKLRVIQKLPRGAGRRLQNHFRAVSGADVTDQLKPVEGRNMVQIDDDQWIDIRINAMPSVYGQDLAIRLFGRSDELVQLDGLGYLPAEKDAVIELLDLPGGLLLVAGPTGSGKTNSLYAFLKYLNRGDRKIHTLEEPVEYLLPGIVQTQINVRAGIDFSNLLPAVLRHAPDVIMIGEIRDSRTADIAVRAGGSGQLVLASVHSQTGVGAIQTMRAYGVNSHFLAGSLIGVIGQRLVRRLCAKCRTEIDVADFSNFHSALRAFVPKHFRPSFFYPGNCDCCLDGYDQLTCIPEVIKVDATLRRAIADEISTDRLQQIAIAAGSVPLPITAQLRAALGITTIEEIIQVLPDHEAELSLEKLAPTRKTMPASAVEVQSPVNHPANIRTVVDVNPTLNEACLESADDSSNHDGFFESDQSSHAMSS